MYYRRTTMFDTIWRFYKLYWSNPEVFEVFQSFLLLAEDAGLLKGVLILGYVPHPHCSVTSTGGQKTFPTAPTTCDHLQQQTGSVLAQNICKPQFLAPDSHSLCPGEPPA